MSVDSLVGTVFSGLSALVIEDVTNDSGMVVVTARTRDVAVPCPACGTATVKVKVHGYHPRTVKDVPVDGRQVVVRLRVRRLVCPARNCPRQTFREQIPGLLERHQRRTVRLLKQISHVARELCGGGGTPGRLARRARVPQHRAAPSVAPAAAAVDDSAGDRRGRLRPAAPPALRHDHHRCRDRPTCGGPARSRRGHPGIVAA
jgi:transposase